MFTAELICFGNELLIGKTVNTNANWLGKRLITLGGKLLRITTIGDRLEDMIQVIREALERKPDVLITTGGLGTTFDDLTHTAIAKAMNVELVLNEDALKLISERLNFLKKNRNIDLSLTEERKRMALFPEGGIPLPNRAGSAPGVFVEYQKTKIFSLPGVPVEMKSIFDSEIVKYLPKDSSHSYHEKSLIVNNVPESELAKQISVVREKYPRVYFKTHPQSSSTSKKGIIEVEIHLTMVGSKEEAKLLKEIARELRELIMQMKGVQNKEPKITTK